MADQVKTLRQVISARIAELEMTVQALRHVNHTHGPSLHVPFTEDWREHLAKSVDTVVVDTKEKFHALVTTLEQALGIDDQIPAEPPLDAEQLQALNKTGESLEKTIEDVNKLVRGQGEVMREDCMDQAAREATERG